MKTNLRAVIYAAIVGLVLVLTAAFAGAQGNIIYALHGIDGSFPGQLALDAAGNIYGSAGSGGGTGRSCHGCSTIFKLSPATGVWTETTIYNFTGGADGGADYRGVVVDGQGNLFGVTFVGGTAPCRCGTIFELSPTASGAYSYQLLYSFTDFSDGGYPLSLVIDAKGNLYATTQAGGINTNNINCGSGCGAVFELSPPTVQGGSWTGTPVYAFNGWGDGITPEGLVLDNAGNLYGFAELGGDEDDPNCYGAHGCGTAFRLSPASDGSWAFSVIYTFKPSDGAQPLSAPVFDAAGNLYGAGFAGGKNCAFDALGCGAIFELSPPADETSSGEPSSGTWSITHLHAFSGGYDGAFPVGPLAFDAAGNIYGATFGGGSTSCGQSHGCGIVFKMSPAAGGGWIFTRLSAFPGQTNGGNRPEAGIILDAAGNLYGSTGYGGYQQNKPCKTAQGCGVIYELPAVAARLAK
jgi:hypothetical protein